MNSHGKCPLDCSRPLGRINDANQIGVFMARIYHIPVCKCKLLTQVKNQPSITVWIKPETTPIYSLFHLDWQHDISNISCMKMTTTDSSMNGRITPHAKGAFQKSRKWRIVDLIHLPLQVLQRHFWKAPKSGLSASEGDDDEGKLCDWEWQARCDENDKPQP